MHPHAAATAAVHHTTQPFIDADQPVLQLFPPPTALYLPVGVLITTFLAAALAYVGWLMATEQPPSSAAAPPPHDG
jgi:hypothetical protein